ncbi:Retrovirus-related Pol polyprotein from transposon [Dictyocoela muelleri]|nr:Retrovirus-related Pol polyprotein from transposon [Dictyocoela muelleri]
MNYTVTEKETLSIILALQHFRTIILNTNIIIFTDHSNLKYLSTSKLQRVQRWKLLIEEFSPTIKFIKGKENVAADYLSRTFFLNIDGTNYDLIRKYHDFLIHPGSKRLYNTISKILLNITFKEIENFTKKCVSCHLNKPTHRLYGKLHGSLNF